jgi:hypothetical protein
MAEPVMGKALRRTALMSLRKAESSQLVWKNRTASLIFEQRVPHLYAHAEAARKAPILPTICDLDTTSKLKKVKRSSKQLARSAVQGILYNQSHVSTVLSRRKVSACEDLLW